MPAHRHDTRYTRTPRHVHVASKAEGKRERRESEARFVRVFGAPYPEQERGTLLSLLSLCLCLLRPVCCAYVSLGLLSLCCLAPSSRIRHSLPLRPGSRLSLRSLACLPSSLGELALSRTEGFSSCFCVSLARSLVRYSTTMKKCNKCGKTVYAAELRTAEGYDWHQVCFNLWFKERQAAKKQELDEKAYVSHRASVRVCCFVPSSLHHPSMHGGAPISYLRGALLVLFDSYNKKPDVSPSYYRVADVDSGAPARMESTIGGVRDLGSAPVAIVETPVVAPPTPVAAAPAPTTPTRAPAAAPVSTTPAYVYFCSPCRRRRSSVWTPY